VREKILLGIGLLILLLVLLFLFFRPEDTDAPTDPGAIRPGFTESTAYCASVQTIDAPDERWAGSAEPAELVAVAAVEFGALPATRNEVMWRCLGSKVFWCLSWGTNWCPKADASQIPNDRMKEVCLRELEDYHLGRSDTGFATIWGWSCVDGIPQVTAGSIPIDSRGFKCALWHEFTVELGEPPDSCGR
jgi:hypothetical protein